MAKPRTDVTLPDMPPRPPEPPRRPTTDADPRVVEFLNSHTELQRRFDAMCASVDARDRTIAQLEDRVKLLQDELDRAQFARDGFQRGFCEMQAQLAILASHAIASSDQISKVANQAIASTRNAMLETGVDPNMTDEQERCEQPDASVEAMRAIENALQLTSEDQRDDVRRVPRMDPDDMGNAGKATT